MLPFVFPLVSRRVWWWLLVVLFLADARAADRVVPPLGTRQAVAFPPGVPAFGDRIAEYPPGGGGFRWKAPEELADFVNESFYPALSTRLFAGSLSARMRARVEAYLQKRNTLVFELADLLVSLHGQDDAARQNALRVAAESQDPRIRALEDEAEALRKELISGGLLGTSVDWNRERRWVLGVTQFSPSHLETEAEYQVARAAVYYADGLLPEQRGLLREISMELQWKARATRPSPRRNTEDPAMMFFSPATTRLSLPKNATPEIVALFARFNGEKTALKAELREVVLGMDKAAPRERTAAFEALADRQWPRLRDLEKRAEEIRLALAQLPVPRLRAVPPVPEPLVKRMKEYNAEREKLIVEFQTAIFDAVSSVGSSFVPPGLSAEERRQWARNLDDRRESARVRAAQEFDELNRERTLELRERFETIKRDLAIVAQGLIDPDTGQPFTPETLVRAYSSAMAQFDAFAREEVIYRGYRLAMLMPGLSPEQRRLLFGAALVGLAQPLPFGEPMPFGSRPVTRS